MQNAVMLFKNKNKFFCYEFSGDSNPNFKEKSNVKVQICIVAFDCCSIIDCATAALIVTRQMCLFKDIPIEYNQIACVVIDSNASLCKKDIASYFYVIV